MANDTQAGPERMNLVMRTGSGAATRDVELPFRVLVLGDFTLDDRATPGVENTPLVVTSASLNQVLAGLTPQLNFSVPNHLQAGDSALEITLRFTSMADFSPDGITRQLPMLDNVLALRDTLWRFREEASDPRALGREITAIAERVGLQPVLEAFGLEPGGEFMLGRHGVGRLLADIDSRFGPQLDAIVQHPQFRLLETAWRSLQFLVERSNPEENCVVELYNVSKQALADDFDDAAEITHSSLYQCVYTEEFGQFGGQPYGVLIGNYSFGSGAPDMRLLRQLAAVASMAHAPFIAAAAPSLFDGETFAELPGLSDLDAVFQQEGYAKWRSLRDSEDARYLALTLPGFLLRGPWGSGRWRVQRFEYRETGDACLWGNSAFAFATRLCASFARYRWSLNITGQDDGRVAGLQLEAGDLGRIPVEVLLPDSREAELAKQGFIPLGIRRGADFAAFYSASSVQHVPTVKNADPAVQIGRQLSGQLSYLLVVSRIAHYLKMMQREHIGAWRNRTEIERELNTWLRQYVSDMDNPAPGVRARRPLRRAQVMVSEVEGKQDWYLIQLTVMPHIRYMGASFTLADAGKLDRT